MSFPPKRIAALAAAVALAACAGTARASVGTVLDFEGLGLSTFNQIPANYGTLAAGTPHITVAHEIISPSDYSHVYDSLTFWKEEYGDLHNVGIPNPNGYLGQISFTPAPGYAVTLSSFDLAGDLEDVPNQTVRIVNGSGVVLRDYSPITIPCFGGPSHLSLSHLTFTPAIRSTGTIRLQFGPSWNVGIDNIAFHEETTPTGLIATPGDQQAALTWDPFAGATGYRVRRSTVDGGPYGTVASVVSPGWTNTGLTNGTTYYYVVAAILSGGDGANSAQASATPFAIIPPAPTNLLAKQGDAKATLSWNTATGATFYRVRRGTTSGGPYTTIATVTNTLWANTGLTNGTTYYYVVAGGNSAGTSPNSAQASVTPLALPTVPTGVVATPGSMKVTLTWNAVSGVTGYRVRRSTVSGGPYSSIASTGATSYLNVGLTNGTTYYYVVAGFNSSGDGPYSPQVSATPN
jgi:fibronectin type 3 domain-containing protein